MFACKKDLTNVVSILVYCPQDNSFLMLFNEERGDYWFPSTKMNEKFGWKDNLLAFKKKVLDSETSSEKLLKIFKIWTLEREFFHLVFQINLPKDVKFNYKTETRMGLAEWHTCQQLCKLKPHLRSLEILEVTDNYKPNIDRETEKVTGETVPMGSLTEIRETDILVTAENCENQVLVDMLDSAGLPVSEQYELYKTYFINTYPCIYMNKISFSKAMDRFDFDGDTESLFRAADVWKRGFLTFQDFMFLIAVMEPFTTHYGHLAQIRCQYIFRYFNDSGNGKLNYNEFSKLLRNIQLAKNVDSSNKNLEKQAEMIVKGINFKTNSLMSFDEFYSYVLQTKIKDTSLLLRFKQSHYDISTSELKISLAAFLPNKMFQSIQCSPEEQKAETEYSIVLKTTILNPEDTALHIQDLRLLEETMTKSVSEDIKNLSNIKLMRRNSCDLEGKINELLQALKYFSNKVTPVFNCDEELGLYEKEAYSWGSAYLEKLGVILMMMCEEIKIILSAERRLLEIDAPCFIMGDIHGNFHDLICFEKILWSNGVALVPANLLFLGDYVDRGHDSIEVIMYLFGNKIQNPNKLFLIRGNHEIRDIQKLFTFQRECIYKFGNTLGMSIWKAVNEAFDTMPLAAIIDRKIFCCHGGIPPPWLCPTVSVINTIPCPLVNCERQSPLAWTLMWNDPLKTGAPRNSTQQMELVTHDGFIPNVQRGTGFYFSSEALDKFLLTNNLSHVVRAHEVVRAGFQIHQKGKLLTVFSSSGYCGGKNFAGSILVADKLLRVCMVDTGIDYKKNTGV